jgi:rod shape-determining protein MreD
MKRLLPPIFIAAALIMDVCVMPLFSRAWWLPSFSLVAVNCYGILLGRARGLWYGLLAGVLIDVTVMTPIGLWTFAFVITGYVSGMFSRIKRRFLFAPMLSALVCRAICELVFMLYVLLASAQFEPDLAAHMSVRIGLEAALVSSFTPLLDIALKPSRSRYAAR